MQPVEIQETGRRGAIREYSVRIAAAHVDQLVAEQLTSLGLSVRLPGFRAGKIPIGVLQQRYGSRARSDVIKRLAGEFAPRAVPEGGILSSLDLLSGAAAGDVELKVTAACFPDFPPMNFSELTLELLLAEGEEQPSPEAGAIAVSHLKQQVLDHLAEVYQFPVAPMLVDRELGAIWRAAEVQLESGVENRAELDVEFRAIAERRVRLGWVVAETAREQGIRVSEEEAGQGQQAGESPAQTLSRLLEENVIAWIVSQAQLKERRVTAEELSE